MTTGEHAGKPEAGPQQGTEILDLENHRGLYGRLLMASQAQPAEVANIINPAKQVEFNWVADKTGLDKRNYNPVFENYSLDERKKEWGTAPFDDAYKQWRTSFTKFMKDIKKDSSRELALKAILPGIEDATKFTENNADALFNRFCKDTSDTHKFISQITEHVINSKMGSTNLQALLPDLAWIASGLFGRKTAYMAIPLINLESLLRGDSGGLTLDSFYAKDITNKLGEDEKRVLGLLHDSFPVPQAKGPAQIITPVIVENVTPQPAPVPVTEPKQEDKDELSAAPVKTSLNSQVAQSQRVVPPVLEKELNELLSGVTSPEELFKLFSGMTDEKLIGVNKVIEEKLLTFIRIKEDFEQTKKKYEELQKANRTAEQQARYLQLGKELKELEKNIASQDKAITQFRLVMARVRERDLAHPATAPESAPPPAPPNQIIMTKEDLEADLGNKGRNAEIVLPAAVTKEAETNIVHIGKNKIKEIKVEGFKDGLMSLEINDKDTGLHWYKREVEGKTYYRSGPQAILSSKWENLPEYLDLPEGLAAKFYIHHYVSNDNENRYMGIMGGKDVKIGLKGDFSFDLSIFSKDYFVAQERKLVGEWAEKSKNREGQAVEMDASGNFLSGWIEAEDVLRHLEKSFQIPDQSLSPKAPNLTAEAPIGNVQGLVQSPAARGGEVLLSETSSRENPNVVNLEGKGDLVKELNEKLRQSHNKLETFSVLPDVLKRYIISSTEGFDIKGGNIKVGKDNQITISDLRITKLGVGVTLDLVLNNDRDHIVARLTKFRRDFAARANKASSREEVERQINNMDSTIKKSLDKEIYKGPPYWATRKISIKDGKVLIEFW